MAEPFLIAGLGNPGYEYENTRHNAGFHVVEELSVRHNAAWKPGKGEYLYSRYVSDDADVILLKPLTYMNNSGYAVHGAMEFFQVPLRNLIVVVDDLAFKTGTIRIRMKGTDGGHNGLRSVIYHLNTIEFTRIRCGIGHGVPPRSMSEFVLSPFEKEEWGIVEQMTKRAADALETIVRSGPSRAMNEFNT